MSATIVVTVAVAFDGSTFTDISNRVTRTSIRYGRDRLLDEFNSGSCIITYDNANNSLTPGHSDSTYGNTQLIGREVRISSAVTGGSDSYSTYLFRGTITDIDYVAGFDTSTVSITVVDGFEKLGRATVLNQSFSAETTSARITNILDLATVDYPDESNPNDRDINTGSITCASASGVTGNALDLIQQTTRTENGRFLVNHAGTPSSTNFGNVLTFFGQNTGTFTRGISFSDATSLSGGAVQMNSLELEFGSELLYNSYEFTPASGSVQSGNDATSVAKYGQRVIKRTLLCDAATTNNAGIYFINLYSEPALRISKVIVDVDAMSAADAEKCLHFNVQSSATLSYTPPGSSAALEGEYVIEGVQYDISVRDMATNAARIQAIYSTSSADTTGYWILEDPVLGVLPTVLAPG